MRVAIQGEPGAFSNEAAVQMAGDLGVEVEIVPCGLSAEVFLRLSTGDVDAAMVPIENSLAGPVAEHYDLLLTHDVAVERESLLRIRHNLIAMPGTRTEDVRRVWSHPVALAQCRRFLGAHPAMRAVAHYDTAGSVKDLMAAGDAATAAIASRQAAEVYGAEILVEGIEDNAENYTRFFWVRRRESIRLEGGAGGKVSIAFSVENRPGTLVRALQVFEGEGTNLTKIESRPVQGRPWEYVFYVDYQLPSPDGADRVPTLLEPFCSMVKVLGRYRMALLP